MMNPLYECFSAPVSEYTLLHVAMNLSGDRILGDQGVRELLNILSFAC